MSKPMIPEFAYNSSMSPVSSRKHRRCSYCFSRGGLQSYGLGIHICAKCKSLLQELRDVDKDFGHSLYVFLKNEVPLFELKSFHDLLKYLVYGAKEGILLKILKELRIRGNMDEYYLDYLRSRIEQLLHIRQNLGGQYSPEAVFTYFKLTPEEIFYVVGHLLKKKFFTENTAKLMDSIFSGFRLTDPKRLGDIFIELAKKVAEI